MCNWCLFNWFHFILWYLLDFATKCVIIIFICAYNYVEDPQMIQLLLYVDIAIGWSYTHDGRADNYLYPHDRRADKDSYPHDRNVTDDLCSLIKLFLHLHVLCLIFQLNVLLLFMLKIIYFKKCLNH